MLPRTYPIDDPLTKALEVVGDRWTLLILREIFNGNERFGGIRDGIGIPRSSLTCRLRRLTKDGLVARVPTDDGRSCAYRPEGQRDQIERAIGLLEEIGNQIASSSRTNESFHPKGET